MSFIHWPRLTVGWTYLFFFPHRFYFKIIYMDLTKTLCLISHCLFFLAWALVVLLSGNSRDIVSNVRWERNKTPQWAEKRLYVFCFVAFHFSTFCYQQLQEARNDDSPYFCCSFLVDYDRWGRAYVSFKLQPIPGDKLSTPPCLNANQSRYMQSPTG